MSIPLFIRTLALVLLVAAMPACGNEAALEPVRRPAAEGDEAPALAAFHLDAAPADPRSVRDARGAAKDGEAVVVVGRVKDFVEGLAAFTLADLALLSCADMGDADHCPTPWDYCCVDPKELTQGTATVEFRRDGRTLREDVKDAFGLDHLAKVVVTGTAKTDEAGNLTVLADGFRVIEG